MAKVSDVPETATAMSAADVSIGYGGDPVVTGASVTLTRGQVTALVGPNGSGKSTLLRGMARLQRLSAGRVTVDDGDAGALSARDADPSSVTAGSGAAGIRTGRRGCRRARRFGAAL